MEEAKEINQTHRHHASNSESIKEKNWYDKYYKIILILPVLMLLFSIIYLVNFYKNEGDIIYKDVSLTGGTTVTVFDSSVNTDSLKESLKSQFPDVISREISDIRTGAQRGFFIESKADADSLKQAIEEYLGYELTSENSSVEFTGSTLSKGFYLQLRNAIFTAFLLMGWVVFFIFSESRKIKGFATMLNFTASGILFTGIGVIKTMAVIGIISGLIFSITHKNKIKKDYIVLFTTVVFSLLLLFLYPKLIIVALIALALLGMYVYYSVPSIAVILAAFADIVITVAIIDVMQIHLSTAGIVAFLMLIGYSVDTDILLTTRLLKNREGSINERIFGAFKTGITMTLAAIAAVGVSFAVIYTFSDTLRQIFGIILIGLVLDIINTWITNASILKWYMEVKKIE